MNLSLSLRPSVIALALIAFAAWIHASPAQEPQPETPAVHHPDSEPGIDRTPHHADENTRLLEEWLPPSDERRASGSGDARGFLAHYLSTRSFAEVWTYYALKLGLPPGPSPETLYQPNYYKQTFPAAGPRRVDGHATLTIKNIQFPEQTERAATLNRRDPDGRSVTVHLASQGEHTLVFVVIIPEK